MAVEPREPVFTGWRAWIAQRLGIQAWGQVLIGILVIAFVAIGGELLRIEGHLTSIDISLQLMPLQLSKDLLSQASTYLKLNKDQRALNATEGAIAVIASVSNRRLQAPQSYFPDVLAQVASNSMLAPTDQDVQDQIGTVRRLIVDYRSAIEPEPTLPTKTHTFSDPYVVNASDKIDRNNAPASVLISNLAPGLDLFQTPLIRKLSNDIRFSDVAIKNATQTLDGIHWSGVVFVNSLIKYDGGEVDLKNVHFVNCTFQFPNTPHAIQFADYVAQGQDSLTIKLPG